MIIRILTTGTNAYISPNVARVIRVYNHRVPSGILESEFTTKGGLLVASAASAYGELPPGDPGQYLTPDPDMPYGLKYETPSVTVSDATNYLVNGGFDFAQEQTPGTLTSIADGAYGPDQWKIYRENNTIQYRRVTGYGVSGLTSPYYGEFTKITNAGKILICQPLEYLETVRFQGNTVSFQLKMASSAARTMQIAIIELQAAGTTNTIPAVVSAWNVDSTNPTLGANLAAITTPVSCAVTTSFEAFTFTGTVPSNSKNLLVAVWSDADFAANDTLSIAEAGLYYGSTLRNWTPKKYSDAVNEIMRYLRKSYDLDTAPGTATSNGRHGVYAVSTQDCTTFLKFTHMRATPTVTIYSRSGTASKVSTAGSIDTGTTVTALNISEGGIDIVRDSGSGFTAGVMYYMHYVIKAQL